MSGNLLLGLVAGVCLSMAIVTFFWSLDTIRHERDVVDLPPHNPFRIDRVNAWQFMERYMEPLAEIINERNRRRGRITLADRLSRAGLRFTSSEFLLVEIALTAAAGILGLLVFGFGPSLLLLAAFAAALPILFLNSRQGARQVAFDAQLAQTVTLLSNSLKTGYSLVQAIDTIAKKSAAPVSDEFEKVVSAIQFGSSVEDALAALVERVQNPDLDFIVIAILLHRKVGGNLAEILDNIGETIRERVRMKREMNVVTAHARASSRVISSLPVILAGMMYMMTPRYFTPMVTNPIGWAMIAVAVVLVISGNLIMSRMSVSKG